MPTLRTYEAATVEEALAKVRDDLGSEVKIVKADRVRTGGLAGFFARERFELQVEVPEGETAPDTPREPTAAAPVSSILDLVDRVSDRERSVVTREAPVPRPSTEEPAFAAVMRRIASEAGLLDEHARPAQPPSEDVADEPPSRPWTPLHVDAPAARPTLVSRPAVAEVEDTEDAGDTEATDDEEGLPWRPAIDGALAPAGPIACFGAGFDEDSDEDSDEIPAARAPRAVAGTGAEVPATALAVREARPVAEVLPDTPIPALLEGLGLPGTMLPATATVDDLVPALLRELRRLPAPPPLPSVPGSITCVAGPRDSALELARTVSEELGLDPDDVVIAARQAGRKRGSGETLASAAAAAEQSRHWRAFATSKVVVVPVEPGSRDATWARRILDALAPEAVWGSVDARRKCEDLEAWCAALGGIDVLSVDHVDDTVSPAAVLRLGIPVALLDARWASAALWALLLAERVTAPATV